MKRCIHCGWICRTGEELAEHLTECEVALQRMSEDGDIREQTSGEDIPEPTWERSDD